MRAGRSACRPHKAEHLALINEFSFFDHVLRHVTIHGDKALSVIKKNRFAVEIKVPLKATLPGPGATIGVPVGAAISRPLCGLLGTSLKNLRCPYKLVLRPSNGIIKPGDKSICGVKLA